MTSFGVKQAQVGGFNSCTLYPEVALPRSVMTDAAVSFVLQSVQDFSTKGLHFDAASLAQRLFAAKQRLPMVGYVLTAAFA